MDEHRCPARVVATALTVVDGVIDAAIVLTEDSTTTYAVRDSQAGVDWVAGVLYAFGVPAWEELRGRTGYALRASVGGPVIGFEHLPTEPGGRYQFASAASAVESAEDAA